MMSLSKHFRNTMTRWLSSVLALLVFVFSLASASPALHHWLHANAACEDTNEVHQLDLTAASANEDPCEQTCGGHHQENPESSDPDCSHLCAVNLLHHGVTTTIIVELPPRIDAVLENLAIESESLWCGQAPIRRSARAPPTVSVV
jgi:hypothetical protein